MPESRRAGVDWPTVITCWKRLKTLCSDDRWPVVNNPTHIAHEGTGFWDEAKGWQHAQLAPDRLPGLYEERIRRAAESRLSLYFFADGTQAKLSEKPATNQSSPIPRRFHANSTPIPPGWLTGKNRLATILNPVQRPTEDMLHHLFWVPIMHWARGRDEGYGWLSSLHGNRNFPGLTDYLRVLSSPTGMTCMTNLRLHRSDTDFLTGKPGELLTCFPKTGPAGMRVLWDALNLSVTSIVPSRVPGTARSRWPSTCARRRGAPRCPRC